MEIFPVSDIHLEMRKDNTKKVCSNILNLSLLSKDNKIILPNEGNPIQFIGCTLWTYVEKSQEILLNYYKNIYTEDERRYFSYKFKNNHKLA